MIFRLSALCAANLYRPLVAGLILLLAALAVPGCMSARPAAPSGNDARHAGREISLEQFRGQDDSNTFAKAMAFLRRHPGSTLVVPPGTYILTSELARETQRKVMAGEYGANPQPVMFNRNFAYSRGISFAGQRGTVVKAYGATLMVDGFMEPISVRDCQDVTIAGFTIDHLRKPFSLGTIVKMEHAGSGARMTVAFGANYRVAKHTPLLMRCSAYSLLTGRSEPLRPSGYEFIDGQTVVYRLDAYRPDLIGCEFYTWHTFHSRPAVLIENAKNIVLRGITIHSQPGMGIVGNRSENIDIEKLNVVPAVGTHMSTNTDATHFTSCKGRLRLDSCVFDGQGDDSLNVHAYYHSIHPVSARVCRMRMDFKDGTHAQSLDYPDAGDTLELTRRDTLEVTARYTVLKCVPRPDDWSAEVTLDQALPEDVTNYFLADITRLPYLEFTNCRARNHYARGILVKTRGALIENNTFEDLFGMGIEIAAESWWQEGVCPANIIVRRNRIINCARVKEVPAICVKPDCQYPVGTPIRNITIEDNLIDCPQAPNGILLAGVDGATIRRNQVNCKGEAVVLKNCRNVATDAGENPNGNRRFQGDAK